MKILGVHIFKSSKTNISGLKIEAAIINKWYSRRACAKKFIVLKTSIRCITHEEMYRD